MNDEKPKTPLVPAPEVLPPAPSSPWTPEKVEAIVMALKTFAHNQAAKHKVPVADVWALIWDEMLDSGG